MKKKVIWQLSCGTKVLPDSKNHVLPERIKFIIFMVIYEIYSKRIATKEKVKSENGNESMEI